MKGLASATIAMTALFSALGQGWQQPYEAGLKAGHLGNWQEARADFKRAIAARPKDSDRPTAQSSNRSDSNRWRNGAPYSPNFLAAYAEYRVALDVRDPNEQTRDFKTAEFEFQHLDAIGQRSKDAYFFLDLIQTHLNDKNQKTHQAGRNRAKLTWQVDEELIAPEELAAIRITPVGTSMTPGAVVSNGRHSTQTILAGELTTGSVGQALNPSAPGSLLGSVPRMDNKYAIVIGEDVPQLGGLPCASYDAQLIQSGLVDYAGYFPGNVTLIQNSPTSTVLDQAKALAAKVPQDGVVLLFYAGSGSSVQGHDYLGASNSASRFDTETLISKSALYSLFTDRGARVFGFFEVNRPIENGYFFGGEVPATGSVSQMEATIPEGEITTTVTKQHQVGLYANAMVNVLAELRSNRVPIYEFGWQVYDKMKRGNTGTSGGGGHQTPTLRFLIIWLRMLGSRTSSTRYEMCLGRP